MYLYADDNGALEIAKLNGSGGSTEARESTAKESVNGHRNRFNGIKSKEMITEKAKALGQKPIQTDIRLSSQMGSHKNPQGGK